MQPFNPFLRGCKNKQHYLKECRKYLLKKYRRLVLKHSLKLALCMALVLLLIGETFINAGIWAFGNLSSIVQVVGSGLLLALDLISRLVV